MADFFAYDGQNTLAFVLTAFFVGIMLACLGMLYQIKLPGRMVRALLKAGADSPEKAVTAGQAGFHREWILRFMMSANGALAKYVGVLPQTHIRRGKKLRPRYADARYYLYPQTRDRAAVRYQTRQATVPALIAAIVVFGLAAVVMHTVIGDLVQMCKNFISIFQSDLK